MLQYTYDFGDNWIHELTVLSRQPTTPHFICTDGSGHGVAEDVKPPGWAELKEAYRSRNPNKEQREHMKWFETQASNCDPDGLGNGREHSWSKAAVNEALPDAQL
jgi:hypothetical protein